MSKRTAVVVALLCLITGLASGWYIGVSRGIPFVGKEPTDWAIGVYVGQSPFDLLPARQVGNPVLTADDVSDVPAHYVADPFMLYENNTWYMFFEVMNTQTGQGDIGLATSDDGLKWTYKQIVLDEPFHLSYPCVFKWQDEYSVDHSRAFDEPKSIPTGCSKPCSLCSGAHSWFFRPFLTGISAVSADAVQPESYCSDLE